VPSKVPRALVVERETTAWRMACAGKSQSEIAEHLGITQPAVSQILKRVSTRVLKDLDGSVARQKVIQDVRLEHIYAESMEAWAKSKTPKKKSKRKKLTAGLSPTQLAQLPDGVALPGRNGAPLTLREETTDEACTSDGNFLFLQTALMALADKRKLWGIDAPKKVDLVDQRRPLEKLTDEELLARARENAALLEADDDREHGH